jgi:hypothetical protein
MPAEADATAKAVAWLMKNKDQLLQVIHDLATPKNEALPTAGKTLMDVIHADPPPCPLERRLAPARRKALMWLESAWLGVCVATLHLCALHGVQRIFSRKDQREQEQMNDIMRSAGAHASGAHASGAHARAPSTSARPKVLLVRRSASHSVLA